MLIYNFKANGVTSLGQESALYKRRGKKLLSYYVVENAPLEMEFSIDSKTILDMEMLESSFDLMTNPLFKIKKRENWMMPTPFVLTDAVVIREKIKVSPVIILPSVEATVNKIPVLKRKILIAIDSLKVD